MSEDRSVVVWQCVHCHKTMPGVLPGSLPYCPFCARPQQPPERPVCVNPNCREQLFTPTAEFCHTCRAPQQPPPGQQRTAPPGPYSLDDRQLRTQTDPSQPPSVNPELQGSAQGRENRTRNGGSFQGGSGDTNNEEFFDAQPVLPHHQTTGHPPPSLNYRGPPPSSQSQGYRYSQVFGMQSLHGGRGGPSQGAQVPPHVPHGQLPYYPQPRLPPGGQWVRSPTSQQQAYQHLQEFGVQQQKFPLHTKPPAAEMVHGQISSSHRKPPPPPPPQPPPSQPTSLPEQPPHTSAASPQIHPGQSHTQLPPSLPPQSSQSSPPSQPGQPLVSGASSSQQPPGDGKRPPGPGTSKEPTHAPEQPQTQLSASLQPHPSQSSPQLQPGQSRASGTSSPQQPPSSGKLHSQPSGPKTSAQEPTSNCSPPQEQEPGNQMQVSPTEGSSALEPKTPPLPPEPPPSHSSSAHPSSVVAPTSDKLPSECINKDSDVASGDGEKDKGNNSDRDSNVANDNGEQSLTQAQDPNVPPEPEPMSSTIGSLPDLQGASDHPVNDGDKNSEGSAIMDGQKPSLEQSEVTSQGSVARALPGVQDTSEHPLDSGGDSDQNSGANKGSRKRTADEDASERSSAKLPKHESKEGDAKKECMDSVKHDAGNRTVEKPLKDELPKQPDKQPIKQPGDSQSGETYATVTRQNQADLHSSEATTYASGWHIEHRSLRRKRSRPPYPNPELGYEHFKQCKLDHSWPSINIPACRGDEAERGILITQDEWPAEADDSNGDPEPGPTGEPTAYRKSEKEEVLFPGTQKETKAEKQRQKENDSPHVQSDATRVHRCNYDHSQHSKPRTHLKGLQSPAEKSIQITFHALVPLPLWGWDGTSCMHIKFGHKCLGMWEHDCGNMTVHRDLGNDWCEMTCTLQIDAAILKYPTPYKYVIYSPKMEHQDDCYEYYHVYHWNPNRCLLIAQGKYQKAYGGTYHHYDTVVYPKNVKPPKSWYERTKEKAKSFFGFGSGSRSPDNSKEEDINILSPFEMGKLCLQVYLEEYKQMMCYGSFLQQAKLQTIVEEICHIFNLLFHPLIFHQNTSTPAERKLDGKFTEVMKEWLESIVDALLDAAAEDTMKQLVSAVCVTHCLRKIGIYNLKQEKFALPLVRMLYLRPDLKRKECPDYLYLCDFLPKQHRSEVATSVALLCKQTRRGKSRKEWLRAVPLYHFLKASSQPFEKLGMNPEKIRFIADQELDLEEFKHKTYDSEEGFVEEHFDKLEHLFALDPLLLRVFVYICPKKDLFSLFERIPPVLSTAWLAHMVLISAAGKFNKNEAKEWIDWIGCIQKLTVNQEREDPQVLVFMVDAALLLFRELSYKLKTCTPHCVNVLKASISLILFAVVQLKASNEMHQREKIITKDFASLKGTLWYWIVDHAVIGGSVFGGTLPARYYSSWKLHEELELWQSLLTLECPPDQQVTEEWHNIVKAHVQKRTNEVPDKLKFDLVCLLEGHEDIHTILTDALMEAGTKAIDNILSKPAKYAEQDFEKLAAKESAHIGMLLGTLLKKKYPNLHPDIEQVTISFDDLLQWRLWPNFIKLYGSKSKLKEGLPQECQIACVCALSQFQEVCDQMQTRKISVTELRKIKEHFNQMKRLCDAATAQIGEKEKGQLSYKAVDSALSQIMEEFDAFEKHKSHLSHLCTHIPDAVQGLAQLKQELQKNFREEKINTLCVREGQKVRVLCFQSAGSLSVFATRFYIMNQKHTSDLFATGWKAAMNAAVRSSAGSALTLADIHSKVWDPAFRNCQSLLQELHDRSMKLARIDGYFKRHERDLEMQVTSLFAGVNACLGETKNGAWIGRVVCRVRDYWHLCNYRKAANAFLELKKALNLQKGDFSDVEKLAIEMTTSMKDQTLEAVDEKLVTTGKFLDNISADPRKLQCLDHFAQCQEVIQWLRDVTNDVNDLQNFVNVALATAAGGEDDFAHDKLSDLRTVGSGFGALIYKLPDDAGYAELARRCTSLWEALQNSQDLPNKLVYCNQQLEWYKSVKETQGSVEVTSFGKMRNVLTYGRYRVGSRSTQTVHSIQDMIHLKLENTGKQLPKTNFSLDDLRDLESKLVLITGSKAENRKEVDQFLNTLHSVCRIADVLLALQQKGNVKYTGWVLSFHCAVDLVDTLQQQAKDMEGELQVWEEQVRQTREQYYELNYYTTLQLLTLRKELGRLKTSGQPRAHTQIDPHVLTLLESISTEITSPDVWEVVKSVTAEQQGGEGGGGGGGGEGASPFLTQYHPSTEKIAANIVGPTAQVVDSIQSNQPTIAKEILSSADLQPSASTSAASLQQPKLTQDRLTEKQKEIFDNIVNCDYPEQAVLIALEKFGEDQYEAYNWVTENAHHYIIPEVEGTGIDTEEMELESDSEIEPDLDMPSAATPLQSSIAASFPPKSPKLSEPSTPRTDQSPRVQVHVTQKQPVDEDHPTVQELVEAGYNVEQSIEAVEHSEKLERAMDYLLSLGGEEGIFQASTSVLAEEEHQYRKEREVEFMEESQQERGLDREATLNVDEKAEERYLMLPELGRVLQALREALPAAVPSQRHFPSEVLEIGAPNLLVTAPENVLKTALALYMCGDSVSLPLPTFEEVLVCNPATTTEEVTLLWQRAIGDPGFKRIFCLLHAEKLSYQVCDQALRSLTELSHGSKQNYRLVIICSNEDEDKSHIISRLSPHKKHFTGLHEVAKYREYLKRHFTGTIPPQSQSIRFAAQGIQASIVDLEDSCVRVVSSTRSGMGKSLFITRMADRLREWKSTGTIHVTVPIHGPVVTMDTVMEFLKNHMKEVTSTIFHFDIAPTILWEVDTILFSLLVLRGLVDSQGRVWRNHPTQLYAVEVTLPEQPEQDAQRTIPENCTLALLELLPSVECLSPRQAIQSMKAGREDAFKVVMDRQKFESAHYQRVYQYLRRHVGNINLDRFSYIGNVEGNPANCLEIILHSCGLHDPSWAEIRHFVKFLDIQLQSCEESVFCDENFVGDVMAGLKGFVVKFMIRMSRDFATSSLHGEVVREEAIGPVPVTVGEGEDLEQYQIVERRRWEQSSHPYIFFNQDGMSITFVGFIVTRNGDLIDPARGGVLEGAIMTSQLYTGLIQNRVNFNEDYRTWQKGIMIEKIATVMGIEYPYDPDESYVLTVDNLIKILAIQMRFRCGIPVVIMGETGCGKTRLIRYMCDLARQGMDRSNMLIMKVHGGITESDVTKFVEKAQEEALVNRRHNLDTVVFFDEANTTDAIGLIKEIMCDHRLHGRPISRDLKFIAACNPYRKHSEEMIEKLESAGLGFYVRATETQQKLGRIPLRQLVYRVLDLPPSMRPLVYDFGQLTNRTEEDYTRQIVSDHVKKHPLLQNQQPIIPAVAKVLAWSQWYMRNREDECSFVSLRDVERAMIVFEYFYDKMEVFGPEMDDMATRDLEMQDEEEVLAPRSPDPITRSLLLAISVCYHARLQEREDYEEGVAAQFAAPLGLPGGAAQFRNEIRCCQEVLLDSMTLGPNIAKNAALRENVFMMAICIELRIPLFLVGKPGSSKSLAKSIVQSSMQGTASNSVLLRGFKQVHIFSYQCSQLSTPESVIEVFNTAKKFQRNQDTSKYVSVVVLDEVGLAEDSPNLPLKALHPLLEDGTEGADEQSILREKRVAFIGISNWALDPAKMNRGVMVTRGNPDTRELQLSARGICSNQDDDPVKRRLEGYFEPLAEAYKEICKKQKREFFGLRDFYSLIKMLYWMCERSGLPLTWPQLEHAICRNFGGMESDELDPLEEFKQRILIRSVPDLQSIPKELHHIVNPDCSRLGLIKTSLMTKETSWHGENRYLLFLTENYAALEILRHYLSEVVCSSPPDSVAAIAPGTDDSGERLLEKMEPFILFGSSFPKDKEYTQVCRNINQIKICMETGRTVILLNLENLYESLYDVLNQYYIYHGGSRYVDLGLQTHRVKCRVHDNFKLIVIAEKKTVYEKFPTPLINRLEKHFVLTSSVLTKGQLDVLYDFQEWIHQFSSVARTSEGRKFSEGDAYIGYQKDTPAAVVFQATHQLKGEGPAVSSEEWRRMEQVSVPGLKADEEEELEEDSDVWKEDVLKMSQYLLLQTASPDALVRLEYTSLADQREELLRIYFQGQHHNSIEDFLAHHIQRNSSRGGGLLMQVTTHSHLLSRDELDHIGNNLFSDRSHVHAFSLQEFDTELDFSNKVGPAFRRKPGDTHHSLLVIQCDSGHLNADLIACARYRIYDKRAEASLQNEREGHTHVLFIIHLPRQLLGSSFVGFQGNPWISAHIDDLRPTTHDMITLHEAMGMSISCLFFGKVAANKEGREEVGGEVPTFTDNLKEMFQHSETEAMQVEGSFQHGFGQDEQMQFEEEGKSKPPQLEQPEMDTSVEGDTPHKEAKADAPEFASDGAKMPERQIIPEVPSEIEAEGLVPHTPPPEDNYLHTQFRRLHGCIQPAASRLQDSSTNKERATKRVAILVSLIPRNPSFPLDDFTFHGVLVRHIHRLLSERDQIREDEKNWVLNEALNTRKLQNGGTFQNVLTRKLDEVLVPIFAEIIAVVDRNYNLDHLVPKKENSPLSQFWLAMFRNSAIVQLRYEDMATRGRHREQVPGAGGRMAEEDFKGQLPFSWLVKEAVDSHWHSAKSTATGSTWGHLHSQLCEVVSQTAVGDVLGSVGEAECEEFFQHYLYDFVRSVHRCYHKQQKSKNLEYKLISGALNSLVHGPDLASIDGHESLISRIAALHVVYYFSRPQVLWFGQLVSNLPGIMTTLEDKVDHDDSEMMLHLYAVDHALGSLEPPLGKKETEDKEKTILTQWLNQLRLSQNAINSILSLPSQSELTKRARMKWQMIRALQMFVEHVVLKHEGMLPYARRLHLHLKHDADFLKASTVDRVKKHLNSMDNELRGKLKSQLKKLTPIRRSCRAFFMELVSSLCFGANSAPEPDLIKMLINMVFTERQEAEVGTRDFSPYHEGRSDEVPIIRSFLLRLLLEHNTEQVKVYLEEYLHKSQQARGELDQNLCLLCIQCFEDALNKEYSLKPSQERATRILDKGHQALQLHTSHSHGEISLGYIEGVAKVRFALSVVAEQFHKRVTAGPALLHAVRTVCTDPTVNHIDDTGQTDTSGPVLYLLKLIVRQFGFPCLTEVSVEHPWVVPHELKKADEEQQTVDPFVIYNPLYSVLRECVSGAVYGKQFQQLTESTRDLVPQDVPLLLLALYEKATLSRASALPSRQLLPDVLEELDKFIKECRVLSKELQWMARSLVANEQGGPLAQLGIAPRQPLQHRTLGAIVVHTAAVFFSRQRVEILQPFVNMLNNPAALVNAYLPTMPEDILPEARRVLGGAFYECPRGHPYLVGECGRPVQELTCNVCGARIGGVSHRLRHDNRNARSNDNTQTGYPLGMPEGRSTVPSPERGLSQAACCIVRALMHSALLWASCNNEAAMEGLMQLVKVSIRPRDLPEFFWHHLERDIELLGRSIGRSMDESAITIHLVLKEILQRDPPTSAMVSTVTSLAARNARDQWENIFNQSYIQPVLQGLEQRVTEAMHCILNDDKQEHDQLFYLVYERVQVAEGSLDPHLWAYRLCITLDHLSQTLQQQNMKKKCPILYAFLQEEPNLRATQYLPDIVRLQQYLYDSFHHRLDRREARTITIGEFLQSRQHENIRNEYQEMVESLQKAWELVGDKLRDHARLRVDEKHLLPSLTLDTSLEYLIPTTTGAGACTTALTDFLVLTHNNFIENCRGIVSKQYKSKSLWQEHKVPITHIHGCHLLTYEHQLPSLVLSHCHYSLAVGKGQDITYDLPALEKQLLDRFIHGKPLILSDIPQVAYRKDVYTAATFAAVRKNVAQEPFSSRIQQEIIQELRTPDRLRETLDVVDIVLGFLSSGGGKADQLLGEYIHHTLKMKRRSFSEKAREYCTLGHVLSLWEALSVELARQLTLQGQEPFDSESMPLHFLEELTADGEEALNHCLRAFDLDKLLRTLYEFIETHVKHSPSNEKEWPLVDTLEVFLERNGLPEIKHFRDEFPDIITLAQSVAVWKHIVRYQKKLGTHGTKQ